MKETFSSKYSIEMFMTGRRYEMEEICFYSSVCEESFTEKGKRCLIKAYQSTSSSYKFIRAANDYQGRHKIIIISKYISRSRRPKEEDSMYRFREIASI